MGVLKHDGHGFRPDAPGTDSDWTRLAGAAVSAVYDRRCCQLVVEKAGISPEEILSLYSDVDVILLEGFKRSPYQKVELARKGVPRDPGIHRETVLAVVTDDPAAGDGLPVFSPEDYPALAAFLVERLGL